MPADGQAKLCNNARTWHLLRVWGSSEWSDKTSRRNLMFITLFYSALIYCHRTQLIVHWWWCWMTWMTGWCANNRHITFHVAIRKDDCPFEYMQKKISVPSTLLSFCSGNGWAEEWFPPPVVPPQYSSPSRGNHYKRTLFKWFINSVLVSVLRAIRCRPPLNVSMCRSSCSSISYYPAAVSVTECPPTLLQLTCLCLAQGRKNVELSWVGRQ